MQITARLNAGLMALAIQCLGACASTPPVTVATVGALPQGASATFALNVSQPAEPTLSTAQVANCLVAAGMTANSKPNYVVDLAYAQRPGRVQLLPGDQAATTPGPSSAGRARKLRSRRAYEFVTLTLSDSAGAKQAFRMSLSRLVPKTARAPGSHMLMDDLCHAIVTQGAGTRTA